MRYTNPELLEFNQNTIDDLLNLACTKISDFTKDGKLYSKAGVMEIVGHAIRYVKTFAYGGDFQGEH